MEFSRVITIIAPYIEKYNLKHIDTGQILVEALEKELITEIEGNCIWRKCWQRDANASKYFFRVFINPK